MVIVALAAFILPIIAQAATPPPIVRTPTFQDETYGDWRVSYIGGGLFIASTLNPSGSSFGELCDSTGCVGYFNPVIACKDKAQYPGLINAPSGSYNVVLTCEKVSDLYLLIVPDNSIIVDAMSIGGVLGIAFPMESGEFSVSRFSMIGGARAYSRAAQLAAPERSPPVSSDTTDYRL